MTRIATANRVSQICGEAVQLLEVGTGWPSRMSVITPTGLLSISAHISTVSPHARAEYEWRFQNPGNRSPVLAPTGSFPLLIGYDIWDQKEVLVVVDGTSRVGRVARFSILFDKRICREASRTGWSEYRSSAGETIYCIKPHLLPLLVEVISCGLTISASDLAGAARASDLVGVEDENTRERLRRLVSSYVRDARFGRAVREAYNSKCAFCGVGLGLTAGAHIYPVSAPNSPDEVWNGIALCHNHHSAFDRHRIWVNSDFSIQVASNWAPANEPESQRFVEQTFQTMTVPGVVAHRPRRTMLIARYQHYALDYRWAPEVT